MPEIVWRFICCSDPDIDDEGRGGVLSVEDGIDLPFQFNAKRRRKTFQLEVNSRIVPRNLHAGDPSVVVPQRNRVQDMQHGMVAHERNPPLPVQD